MKLSRHEWMILAGVIVIVASVVIPASCHRRNLRRVQDSRRVIDALLNAGARYRLEYGFWPAAQYEKAEGDIRFGWGERPNRKVMNVLRAQDGLGNPEHVLNVRRIPFIDLPVYRPGRAGLNEEGDLLDAWGMPYQIVVDTNMDGICEVQDSIYGGGIDGGMIIWSCGPDRLSDTRDDILSWRR